MDDDDLRLTQVPSLPISPPAVQATNENQETAGPSEMNGPDGANPTGEWGAGFEELVRDIVEVGQEEAADRYMLASREAAVGIQLRCIKQRITCAVPRARSRGRCQGGRRQRRAVPWPGHG